ncbi:ATP-binding cassette sub-family C member 4-like isoform X2 [Haliotis rufescens]|uniref:ATP-binding cassette sub-family C member 4-like isoform X2 n=1 Tax=Haliotis rufescens TaxID=6454 RepID=UPI00201EE9F2|nr:ATP-binding cassette sub-family C member 4-like isoform X2 [Haliotis rufescens]
MDRHTQCPYDKANWFSRMTFWWISGLFRKGYKKDLDISDVYDVCQEDEASQVVRTMEGCWKDEIQKLADGKNVSLFKTVFRAFKLRLLLPGISLVFLETLKITQPLLIGQVILFFSPNPTLPSYYAYIFAAALGLVNFIQTALNTQYFYNMQHTAMKMKVAVAGLVYKKVLTLSCQSFYQTTSGQIVNFLSTDVEMFNNCIENIHYLWLSPFVICVVMYLMYREVGVASVFGLLPVLIFLPSQIGSGKLFGVLRMKTAACGDERIHTMTEIVSGIRVIKMYCWEKPFGHLINKLRQKEVSFLKLSFLVKALTLSILFYITRVMALFIFVGNWLFLSHPISTSSVFVTLGLLEILKMSAFFFLTYSVETLSQLSASMQRIQKFLLLDEEKDLTHGGILHKHVQHRTHTQSDVAVVIDYVTARWEMSGVELRKKNREKMKKRDSTSETSKLLHESEIEHYFALKSIALNIKKGELMAVVGTVGSGKTSLLLALLGEFPYQQGQITLHGSVGYAAQQSWVFSGSVKQNILFGDQYDFKRYDTVVEACALQKDIGMMKYGDETLVGERGLFLSGGQKARLSLARSVYRDCDIYLLDDPLSAVDTKVGRHIFNKCIKQLLKEKTVVLVTHQLQYLRRADRIVVLREGSVFDVGTYDELEERGVDLATFLETEDKHAKDEVVSATDIEEKQMKIATAIQKEEQDVTESGAVGIQVYAKYLEAGYGVILGPIALLLGIATESVFSASNWMLAKWSESLSPQYVNNTSGMVNATEVPPDSSVKSWDTMELPLQFFVILVCAHVVLCIVFSVLVFQIGALSSQRLHDRMFAFVLGARSRFFDVNPVGRILNRFSRDLGFVDILLNRLCYATSQHTLAIIAAVLIVCIIAPWLFIALVPALIIIFCLRFYAIQTTRDIKRIEANVRSPMYSHVSDTILGLQTIRALNKQDQFQHEFDQHVNIHSSAWFTYLSSFRWYSFRSVLVMVVFFNIVIYVCLVLKDTVSSGLLSLALVYCTAIIEPFEFLMRITAEVENYMTSVERILSYNKLAQEGPMESDRPPPDTWPMQGTISFSDTSLRYEDNLPYALKHINFHIKSKEKIGIVGRTGAGKSSLLAALLRLAEPEGKMWIDGMDVNIIGLTELRGKISVIPQDPVLFTGSLRRNLDPLEVYTDDRLWEVLEQVQLKTKIQDSPGGLYMGVAESGHNFSVGQRQLVCLARALLAANKILVLDEATAHVDHETDQLIQRVLRAKFRECTVLTIAHRLNTVMDCDRIMVLDEGELKEFDIPYNLLLHKDGYFCKLVDQLGKQQARQLHALAELAYHQRASASMLLEEAVKSATEIFRNSREDLRRSKDSLMRSKDSLDTSQTTLNTIENSKTLYGRYSTPVKSSPKPHRKIRHVKSSPAKESPKVHRRTPSKSDIVDRNDREEIVPLVTHSPDKHTLEESPVVSDGRGGRVSPIKKPISPLAEGSRTLSPKGSPRIITGLFEKHREGEDSDDQKIIFC